MVLLINLNFCAIQLYLDLVITIGHLAGLNVVVWKWNELRTIGLWWTVLYGKQKIG